jgi:hypothetical protein
LKALYRLPEAISDFDKAIALKPNLADAYFNKSIVSLLLGDLESGLRDYEWRKKINDPAGDRHLPRPLWLGEENLSGKTLFIHSEQGLGDTIQFCRYALLARARGARVVLSVQEKLVRLIKSLDDQIEVIADNQEPPTFDLHCPMLSLPLAFGTTPQTIPSKIPYLRAESQRISRWAERLGSHGFKICICWHGSTSKYGLARSFPLSEFREISQLDGVRLISLQKGTGESQLESLPDDIRVEAFDSDFDAGPGAFLDTAAVMKCCDLVITCDTAIEHVAGALAIPVWVVLQRVPDWRWMLDRSDTPWYPTMRLFRQTVPHDWRTVFSNIKDELVRLMSA